MLFYSHCVSSIQSPQVSARGGYLELSAGCLHLTCWTDNCYSLNACWRLVSGADVCFLILSMCLNLNTSSVYRTQLPAPPRRGLRGHVTLEKKSLLKEISESCHDNTAGTSGLCALNDNWALPWLYIHVRWDLITYPIESSEHQNGGAGEHNHTLQQLSFRRGHTRLTLWVLLLMCLLMFQQTSPWRCLWF